MKASSVGRPGRPALLALCLALLAALLIAPPALARANPDHVAAAVRAAGKSARDVQPFYEARGYRLLWLKDGNARPAAAHALVDLLSGARYDGLDPRRFRIDRLAAGLSEAPYAPPERLAQLDVALSQAFAEYVRGVRQTRVQTGMHYESAALAPVVPTPSAVLESAADAPSLERYVERLEFMHPLYLELRTALAGRDLSRNAEQLLRANLERARALPSNPGPKYVLVDAAAARLYMIENGRIRDSMKVVVGKPEQPTPMMAGFMRYTVLNPYWNIPPDLVQTNIAGNAVKNGPKWVRGRGYEVLSDWTNDARLVDPATVDWKAVAAGKTQVRVRQKPGKDNFMGRMKFMFPNEFGVYLHDTPNKGLLEEPARNFSSGCVRLEDAPRLARWLYGKPLASKSPAPEQEVPLDSPVPVYITYFTASFDDGLVLARPDVYNRDAELVASLGSGGRTSR